MTSPPPRKRFQIHLSTAIVMMFVTGGLIWGNLREYEDHCFGWPWACLAERSHTYMQATSERGDYIVTNKTWQGKWNVLYEEIVLDASISIAILVMAYFLCERLIRHFSTPPPRRFFAIPFHLSTAIVMVIVAGGVIWANSVSSLTVNDRRGLPCPGEGFQITDVSYGWPCSIRSFVTAVSAREEDPIRHFDIISSKGAFLNALVFLVILIAVYVLCEWLFRRRAARKRA